MKNLKLYCPKCGSLLSKGYYSTLYQCTDLSCDYKLNEHNTIDIGYKSKGIAKALSNLSPYPFILDGVYCECMEAFIQSLKIQDIDVQKDVCSKPALFCYGIREMHDDWRISQTVYWRGKEIDRHSEEYMYLLRRAYKKLYDESPTFRYALEKSKGYTLIHSIGCTDDTQTLLTPDEYIQLLNELR